MADLLAQVGGTLSTFGWASMGNIVLIISILFLTVVVFGIIGFVVWWKSFGYKVRIYEPRGQINLDDKEIEQIQEEAKSGKMDLLEKKNIKFDMLKIRKTHGKYITFKKAPYFKTFLPLRRHQSVPMELLFDDGVHLLKLSRDIYVPISKPKTTISVGESVSISVTENNQWKLWDNMESERINNKYQDVDAQKRAITYFVIGIVAMVLVGGFILWLIYSSVNKGFNAVENLNSAVNALTKGVAPK